MYILNILEFELIVLSIFRIPRCIVLGNITLSEPGIVMGLRLSITNADLRTIARINYLCAFEDIEIMGIANNNFILLIYSKW